MKFINLILCLFGPFSILCAEFTDTNIFFVSQNGNDGNPGTQEAPFLTLQRAQAAVRALPSSAFKNQDVYVLLREGTYRMQQPLVLTPEDSGREGHDVVYSSYPGETAILSGAIQARDWTFNAALGAYQSNVGPCQTRQLYVNGTRAVRAQTTPYPVAFLPNFLGGGIDYLFTTMNPAAWNDPTTWTNQKDIEAVIITQWKMMRVPINSVLGIPGLGGLITMQEPAWTNSNVNYSIVTNQPGIWSFWQVTRFENALQFLTQPGQWYLDYSGGILSYIPLPGEDITTADVELPLLETLVVGQGTLENPIHNIRFEGLTFSYATWLGPNSDNGYVADQSGCLLLGAGHQPNYIGHDPNVVPTPGNIQFTFAHNIVFYGNIFQHLGAVGLQLFTGCQHNTIDSNLFTDISSAAISLGEVAGIGPHPSNPKQMLKHNLITNNLIKNVGAEYVDAAGIFVGFTKKTTISHNTISNVPWSGIAMGWGWGLLDKGSFPGLPNAHSGQWGTVTELTPNFESVIKNNKIYNFLNTLWDGGAIYTTGRQGPSLSKGLLIKENVAYGKRPDGGGNIFYTDGGSRYIQLERNVSFNNPIGITFFGPPSPPGDPLPYPPYSIGNNLPYGCDSGGCVTFGDIRYVENYWLSAPAPNLAVLNFVYHSLFQPPPYSYYGFFSVCPSTIDNIKYPINLEYKNNHPGFSLSDVPSEIMSKAGVQQRPSTIPQSQWVPSP